MVTKMVYVVIHNYDEYLRNGCPQSDAYCALQMHELATKMFSVEFFESCSHDKFGSYVCEKTFQLMSNGARERLVRDLLETGALERISFREGQGTFVVQNIIKTLDIGALKHAVCRQLLQHVDEHPLVLPRSTWPLISLAEKVVGS
jgi:hypothetical protein